MKRLKLDAELSGLGAKTHVWFPVPAGNDKAIESWFDVLPTKIRTDKKNGNKIAYFFFSGLNRIQIEANFPISQPKIFSCDKKQFLVPNRFVVSNDAATIYISHQLTRSLRSDNDKARYCFDWVVEYLSYGNPIRGLYSSLQALTDRHVDCGGFSTLLVALLRSIGIPARCVFGWAIRSKYGYHAWVEYFDREKSGWISLDPSVAHLGKRTKLDAGFGFIHDERVTFSVGEDLVLEGSGITWPTPLLQAPVVVSLDGGGIPVAFTEKLDWKFQSIN